MRNSVRILLHISVALIVVALFFIFGTILATDFIEHPDLYIGDLLSSGELAAYIARLSVVVVSVLAGYVVYLLLAGRLRAQAAARFLTRDIALGQEEFRRLYDNAPVPYLSLHEDGKIQKANKAALRLLHATDEELLGSNFFSLFYQEDAPLVEQFGEYFHRHVPVDRKEVRIVTKQGDVRWTLFSLFDVGGDIGIATLFDITEAKRLDEAKSDFVSLASHQLRTPLAAVRWQTDFLLGKDVGALTDKQRTYIERIRESNMTMIELVDALLNVSRIETGKLAPEQKQVNGHEIAESVLEELSHLIKEKEIKLERVFAESWESVTTDPRLLRMVFQNLLSNAVKYTPIGGTVRFELGQEGRERRIVVEDTGVGIPADVQDRIFTKMFRADNARKIDVHGTGLGLYLVKQIVELLEGSMSFVSEEGKGTTFTIVFH